MSFSQCGGHEGGAEGPCESNKVTGNSEAVPEEQRVAV